MTIPTLLLAQAEETAPELADTPLPVISQLLTQLDILNHPNELMGTLASMHIVWASVLVVVGALCILNGYRWHKYVIVICAFLGGLGLGHLLSQQMASPARLSEPTPGLPSPPPPTPTWPGQRWASSPWACWRSSCTGW